MPTSLGPRTVEGGPEHPPPSAQWAPIPSHIEAWSGTLCRIPQDGRLLKTKDKKMSELSSSSGREVRPGPDGCAEMVRTARAVRM